MDRHVIGDGTRMRILLDPWHSRGILKETFPIALMYNRVCNLNNRVSSLIEEGIWCIPDQVRRHIPEVIDAIEETEL